MHTINQIKEDVSEFFNLDLSSKTRDAKHFRARSVFYKLCFNLYYNPTYQAVGEAVNRDHATVIHSIRNWDNNLKYDYDMRKAYEALVNRYKNYGDMSFSDILIQINKKEEEVEKLKNEVDFLKNKNKDSGFKEIDSLKQLLQDMSDDEQASLRFKLDALYNLNKRR